jgi:hypothetical protein
MTVATIEYFPITRSRNHITRHVLIARTVYEKFRVRQEFFPIFGVILGALAMASTFVFERSALLIGS